MKKHLVVLTGAGMSAESGLKTFRASDGLWENHKIEEVATPEGFRKNPELVLRFYNERREQVKKAKPNSAHLLLAELEKNFQVSIITQNIDNLHERAGSSSVLHLHGEIMKARSSTHENLVYEINGDIQLGDTCEKGSQLRPFIVWFSEAVPLILDAIEITRTADILVVIGTSLAVYPAASLVGEVKPHTPIYVIDPELHFHQKDAILIPKTATEGVKELVKKLQTKYK